MGRRCSELAIAARASILEGTDFDRAMRLLDRKYFPWKQLLGFFARFRGHARAVVALRPVS